jgi:hypothetical protein
MMEKVIIELAALFWASGIVSLMVAKMLFDRYIRTQESSGKAGLGGINSSAPVYEKGAGRFSAVIGIQGRG